MSAREETLRQACGLDGKSTRDGSQPHPGGPTRPRITEATLARLRTPGPRRPRGPRPDRRWMPVTGAEVLLDAESSRWHRVSQMLLDELGRVRLELAGALAARRLDREALGPCPLTGAELRALTAAAAGESAGETARRLLISEAAVKQARQAAVQRLGARSAIHAVALAAAAGWIRPSQLVRGGSGE